MYDAIETGSEMVVNALPLCKSAGTRCIYELDIFEGEGGIVTGSYLSCNANDLEWLGSDIILFLNRHGVSTFLTLESDFCGFAGQISMEPHGVQYTNRKVPSNLLIDY